MKFSLRTPTAWIAACLCVPAGADVIYSNLLDTPIPTNFTGVTITVDGGTINPFFGGVGVANDDLFQPVRIGTGNLDTIRNMAVGSVIDVGDLFSTGYGGSQDHLGTTFTAGQEGYIGFRTNGTNYGWMRVIFTGNTAGAVVKDWAYDNSGADIVVGRVQQSAASGGAQLVTLSPGTGESFNLGSQLANTGGNINSVVKTGLGTTSLTAANTYTGTTSVNAGRLNVNASITSDTTVGANGEAATLGGDGTITGDLALGADGMLLPGQGGATDRSLRITGNVSAASGAQVAFTISSESSFDQLIVDGTMDQSNLGLNLTVEDTSIIELGAGLGDDFLAQKDSFTGPGSFYKLIAGTTEGMFGNAEAMSDAAKAYYGLTGAQYTVTADGREYWIVSSGSTYLVAIPETTTSLLLALGTLGLVLRRRRA